MATDTPTTPTIDSAAGGPPAGGNALAHRIVVACVLVAAALGLAATLRLGMVVLATPPREWLTEVVRVFQPDMPVDPATVSWARFAAQIADDPAFVLARLPGCIAADPATPAPPRCLDVIEVGLQAAPWSGELWLAKALWLLGGAQFDDRLFDALRRSWRTAPREGWIAARRVVVGLRLYPLLPDELKPHVRDDLELVLTYPEHVAPLIAAYVDDPHIRESARAAVETLPPRMLAEFIGRVQERAANGPGGG